MIRVTDAQLIALRKLKTPAGVYVWQHSVYAGVPDELLGFPCVVGDETDLPSLSAELMTFYEVQAAVLSWKFTTGFTLLADA